MNVVEAPPPRHVLLATDLVAGYVPEVDILNGCNVVVNEGEFVGIIGPNGAGKSTLLKAVLGLCPVRSGTVMLGDRDITGFKAHQLVSLGVGYVPQNKNVFQTLTVTENLEMGCYGRKFPSKAEHKEKLDWVFETFPRLKERATQVGGTLSGGEQQMLAIGRALMARPKVLLLDEPSMGLAPMVISQIFKIISEINKQGTTVLLVEQNAQQALSRSDRAYILETGSVTRAGVARDLLADDSIRAAYLGVA